MSHMYTSRPLTGLVERNNFFFFYQLVHLCVCVHVDVCAHTCVGYVCAWMPRADVDARCLSCLPTYVVSQELSMNLELTGSLAVEPWDPPVFLSEVLGWDRGQGSFPGPAGILLLISWLILSTYKVIGYIIMVSYTDTIVICSYLLHLPPFLICTIT